MTAFPITPDFDVWPVDNDVQSLNLTKDALSITWTDGLTSQHHSLLLRENSPDPVTTHPKAREMAIGPEAISEDLQLTGAQILASGAVDVTFSDGLQTEFHPGWLRGTAWFGTDKPAPLILWTAKELATDIWEYNNRSKTSDYRGRGPVIETDTLGTITGVRYNTFLRAPMRAPLEVQARAYKAYRAFSVRAQSPEYQMRFRYEPGDLLAFDNRRALHGRAGYDAKGGARYIEGIYSDRDDLHSRIRTLKRQFRAASAL